jgi:CheY-like chemotaxis protein
MAPARILIVEDESIVALDISSQLKRQGYSVAAILSSGEAAVSQVSVIKPDLVLMDIRLQGEMDGVEAAHQIRTQSNVPLIFLTAYADKETLQRAATANPQGYLIKPFKEIELHQIVEKSLQPSDTEH